jgi:hypothetical protein
MGKSFSKRMTIAVTIGFILVMAVLSSVKGPQNALSGEDQNRGFFSRAFSGAKKLVISPYTGRTIFKTWTSSTNSSTASTYKNDYRASESFVAGGDDVNNNPLVASTTFIGKKGMKKVKGKPKKVADAAKKEKASKKKNGLSETPEFTSFAGGSSSPFAFGGGGGFNQKTAKEKEKEEEEQMNTVEYWEVPIFEQQDPEAVTKLIDSYKGSKVSSNVFYELVEEMNHHESETIRVFGIQALKATPSSKSFAHLTWVKHNDTETELRKAADQEVNNYTSVSRLNYVINSLNASGDNAQKVSLEAMSVITKTAKRFDDIQQSNVEPDRNTASTTQGLQNKLTVAYNTLGTLAQTTSDTATKAEAEKTMEAISKVMTI